MTRWSFIKRVGAITHEEFVSFARQFCDVTAGHIKIPLKVKVIFYRKLPHSVTTWQSDEERKWLGCFNKERELAVLDGVGGFNNKELFEQAAFVKMVIRPADQAKAPQYTFGVMKCKGFLPRHVVYYLQPQEVSEPVKTKLLARIPTVPAGIVRRMLGFPPRVLFGVGDGFERNYPISLH